MSLQTLAQDLASRGRYGDSMMVHMNPIEVQGLQALAEQQGTTLTINPDTGMPEAFLPFLAPLIGAVAPALTAGTFLAPLFATPLASALTVGAIGGLASGDLKTGLMAGLGAFGGGHLGSAMGIGGAGAAGTGAAGTGAATQAVLPTATQQAGGQSLLADVIGQTGAGVTTPGTIGSFMQGGGSFAPMQQVGTEAAKKGLFGNLTTGQKILGGMGLVGAMDAMQPPMTFPETKEESKYEGPYYPTSREVSFPTRDELLAGGSYERTYFDPIHPRPGYYSSAQPMALAEGGEVEDRRLNLAAAREYAPGATFERDYGFRPVQIETPPPPKADPRASIGGKGGRSGVYGGNDIIGYTGSGEPIYRNNPDLSAMGPFGLIFSKIFGKGRDSVLGAPAGMSSADAKKYGYDKYTNLSNYRYDPASQKMLPLAAGGLATLADGGVLLEDGSFVVDARTVAEIGNGSSEAGQERLAMLGGIPVKGPGDGVSDDIPANIEGEQEARVARDEVVFPASAVKELGGGSAKRGADKLYAMMERAHEARKEVGRGEDAGLGALMPS